MFIERSYNFDRILWRKLMIPPTFRWVINLQTIQTTIVFSAHL